MKENELKAVVAQLRRAADLIEMKPECEHARRCKTRGQHALVVTRDWSVPLTAEPGPRPKGDHSDPTASVALGKPDPLAREHAALEAELRAAWRTAGDLVARIIGATTSARIVNERLGIGFCEVCGRYCNGERNNRLRAAKCNACRMKAKRAVA